MDHNHLQKPPRNLLRRIIRRLPPEEISGDTNIYEGFELSEKIFKEILTPKIIATNPLHMVGMITYLTQQKSLKANDNQKT